MIGTWLNVAGILLGGMAGLLKTNPLPSATQSSVKAALGVFTLFCGLWLMWVGFSGPWRHLLGELAVVIVSLGLGRLAGRALHLQKASNRLGRFARDRMTGAKPEGRDRFSSGFQVCATLFCAAPLGVLGAIQDGLSGYFYPLLAKAVMDGLAAMGFVSMFGWGVLFSAVPVLVFQGTITLLCARFLTPFLSAHHLVDPVNAVGGFLVTCVALIIFEIKRVEVTDYLPSLVLAPLLAWWLL